MTRWQIIQTESFNEPWWFFDDWQEDIVLELEATTREEAKALYIEVFTKLHDTYGYQQVKKNTLAAFWCDEEKCFCEECDDDLQVYHGLLVLKDGEHDPDLIGN